MLIIVKNTTSDTLSIYEECFANNEFKHFIGGVTLDGLKESLNDSGNKHFTLFYSTDEIHEEKVGFCAFNQQGYMNYFFVGGCLPSYFNKGLGIYACIAVLNVIFGYNCTDINTIVMKDNSRSKKMLYRIGFRMTGEEENYYILKLKKEWFPNDFGIKILQRTTIKQCI